MSEPVTFEAALAWHEERRRNAPDAPSVRRTRAILDRLEQVERERDEARRRGARLLQKVQVLTGHVASLRARLARAGEAA